MTHHTRRRFGTGLLAAGFLLAASGAAAGSASVATPTVATAAVAQNAAAVDHTTIHRAIEAWNDALNTGDIDALAAVSVLPYEARAVTEWVLDRFEIDQQLEVVSIEPGASGGVMVHIAGELRMTGREGMLRFVEVEKPVDTVLDVAQRGGSWRVTRIDRVVDGWME